MHAIKRWSALAAATLAAAAFASPRESFTFTNVGSNGSNLANQVAATATGGYPVYYIKVAGTLTQVAAATYPQEANIHVYPPDNFSGNMDAFTIQPFQQSAPTASVTTNNYVFKLPVPVPATGSAGSWGFRFYEAFDDAGTGVDSTWSTITFTLDDGPPANINLGTINNNTRFAFPELAGGIHWYKFEVRQDVTAANGQSLRIDTLGSTTTDTGTGVNDTEIGVYDADGRLVANDDDSGGGRISLLTFGAGGTSGNLPAGIYYLAAGCFNMNFFPADWNVTTTATATGTIQVNFSGTTGAPAARDIGSIRQEGKAIRNQPLANGQVRWYRFNISADMSAANGNFLVIDALGSSLTTSGFGVNDTEIGVYTAWGSLVAANDDFFGLVSRLGFGATANSSGTLPFGTYYIAVTGFPTTFGADNWNVSSTSTAHGSVQLNFTTNTGGFTPTEAACPADIDDGSGTGTPDGGVTIDDLLFFISRYSAGC